jgi:hypothetical protein
LSTHFLRRAPSLVSAKITHRLMIALPDPLRFFGVSFEPRQSLKYRSNFDVRKLILKAKEELSEEDPETFKVFLLAVLVGLSPRDRSAEVGQLSLGYRRYPH